MHCICSTVSPVCCFHPLALQTPSGTPRLLLLHLQPSAPCSCCLHAQELDHVLHVLLLLRLQWVCHR